MYESYPSKNQNKDVSLDIAGVKKPQRFTLEKKFRHGAL